MKPAPVFMPAVLDTVVVMALRPIGTIKRYRNRGGWIVSVPGILAPETHRGQCFFKTLSAARKAVTQAAATL